MANRFEGSYRLHDRHYGKKHAATEVRAMKRQEAEDRNAQTSSWKRSRKTDGWKQYLPVKIDPLIAS